MLGIVRPNHQGRKERTMAINEILRDKGCDVQTISPQATVFAAIERMVSHGIGALAVVDDGRLVGMLTERDYLRRVALEGRTSRTTLVREIMTPRVVTVRPSDGIDESLEVMTAQRLRHLPVIEQGELVGIVSMGDLVKRKVADKELEITQLVEYIQTSGCPPV
jgi:CBS domain-containing protein